MSTNACKLAISGCDSPMQMLTMVILLPFIILLLFPLLASPFLLPPSPGSTARLLAKANITPAAPLHNLVIVESPSKCSTISSILNKARPHTTLPYLVLSSNGHICDLPTSSSLKTAKLPPNFPSEYKALGVNVRDDYEPLYITPPRAVPILSSLLTAAKAAETIYLATDCDREGESISAHLNTYFRTNAIDSTIHRITFTSITPSALHHSLKNPTTVDANLVAAQEARRILDRLAGYTISPVLWKKIAPGLSAGRVQTVGLNVLVEREYRRMNHTRLEYWSVGANVTADTADGESECESDGESTTSAGTSSAPCGTTMAFEATLHSINNVAVATGKDIDNDGCIDKARVLLDEPSAAAYVKYATSHSSSLATVTSVTSKPVTRNPPLCYITSTLQQDAANKLGVSVQECMRVAQFLYERGFISYMRTDNKVLGEEAEGVGKKIVEELYGGEYVYANPPKKGGAKKDGAKKGPNNSLAQEAHEPIRPAILNDTFPHPTSLSTVLPPTALKLYTLIYKRTLASLMPAKVLNSTSVTMECGEMVFRSAGSTVVFDGYDKVLVEGIINKGGEEKVLPHLYEGQSVTLAGVEAVQHVTSPPARYTEASFVRELEALGVGRPSTYASVIGTLRQRGYVVEGGDAAVRRGSGGAAIKGSQISALRASGATALSMARGPLRPSLTAFVVVELLKKHCGTYVESNFTRGMEEQLDLIAKGEVEKSPYLKSYYEGEQGLQQTVARMELAVEGDGVRRVLLPHLAGDVGVFVGPWGPYCARNTPGQPRLTAPLPGGIATDVQSLTVEVLEKVIEARAQNGTVLGTSQDGRNVSVKSFERSACEPAAKETTCSV